MMALLDKGWTEEQASGLLDCLELTEGVPNWNDEHLERLREWCSEHEQNHTTIEGQLEFVAYELCNIYVGVGMALRRAKTREEARQAVQPYVRLLSASKMQVGWGPKLPQR
jgi:hypothetical protein